MYSRTRPNGFPFYVSYVLIMAFLREVAKRFFVWRERKTRMEKVWKRLIAVSLSLMLMFTMGLNVFAAENVEGTPSDDPAVTLDEGDAVATEAEPAGEEVVLEEESSDETVVQEEEPAEEAVVQEDEPEVTAMGDELTAQSEDIDLTITNNTSMFKAETAYLTTKNDQEYLVMALSGTGYKELYKGTYEAAVENGDGSADKGNNTWIHSTTNDAGKYEFTIPLNADESFVPVVAISNSYYTKYLNGQNDLSRAFYPRQFTVDREAKTIVTDDYNETSNYTVTSNVADFKVADTAATHVVGGPNSNNYSVAPTLVMEDSAYDKVTFPTVVGNAISTADATLVDGKFAISMTNAPNKEAFKDKTPIEMTFHVAEDAPYVGAGTNVVRTVTIDKSAKTIEINGDALTVDKFEYDGTTVQFIKKDGSAFGMWTPQEGSTYTYNDGKIHMSIIPKNKTVYGWMHWGGINEELTKDVELDSDGTIVFDLDTENCGWAIPVAPIKKKDGTTTSDQYYLAVPALEYFTADADYTAVDAALETVPADLSIYTEETAAAVNEAVNAVVRGKKAVEQADVDGMADAIEKAVKGLRVAKFEYEGTTVQFIKKDGSAFGMWIPQEGSTYTYSDGKIHISITPKNTTVYGWMHWGGINEELTKDVELDSDGKIVFDLDTENCGWAVPVAPIKKKDGATTSDQYYLAVPALENFDADYAAVDAALEKVPEDLSIYTKETAAAVTEAVNAVVRDKKANEQADVDGMANAIDQAVKALVGKLSFATIDVPAQTYTGKALTPATVTFDGKTLVKDTDYTVEYSSNTNVGTATVTINGTGNYTGTKTAEFKINAKKITPAVTLSTTTYTYNGKAKTPAVTVKDGAKTLTKNTDYTVSYAKGRINAGSYKVTVTLKGNYSGSAYKTIKINPAVQKLTMSAAQKSVKFKALKKKAQTTSKVAVSGAKTKVTYAKVSGSSKLTINKTTGKITVKKKTKKGTYSIKVKATAAKSTNYKAATVTKTIKVKVK